MCLRFSHQVLVIVLFTIGLMHSIVSNAQTASLQLIVRDTSIVSDPYPLDDPYGSATIVNNGQTTLRLIAIRTVDQLPTGQRSYFCFDVGCYAPFTNQSSDTLNLAPGAQDNTFKAYFTPNGVEGIAVVRYEIRDVVSGVSATMRFSLTATVTSTKESDARRALVQSALPTSQELRLAAAPGVRVWLRDVTGRPVVTTTLSNQPTTFNIESLPKGTYLLTTSDGRNVRIPIQ